MEAAAAARLALLLESGLSLEEATRRTLDRVRLLDGDGGLIAVTAAGQLVVGFNSPDMAYGVATAAGLKSEVGRGSFILVQ